MVVCKLADILYIEHAECNLSIVVEPYAVQLVISYLGGGLLVGIFRARHIQQPFQNSFSVESFFATHRGRPERRTRTVAFGDCRRQLSSLWKR